MKGYIYLFITPMLFVQRAQSVAWTMALTSLNDACSVLSDPCDPFLGGRVHPEALPSSVQSTPSKLTYPTAHSKSFREVKHSVQVIFRLPSLVDRIANLFRATRTQSVDDIPTPEFSFFHRPKNERVLPKHRRPRDIRDCRRVAAHKQHTRSFLHPNKPPCMQEKATPHFVCVLSYHIKARAQNLLPNSTMALSSPHDGGSSGQLCSHTAPSWFIVPFLLDQICRDRIPWNAVPSAGCPLNALRTFESRVRRSQNFSLVEGIKLGGRSSVPSQFTNFRHSKNDIALTKSFSPPSNHPKEMDAFNNVKTTQPETSPASSTSQAPPKDEMPVPQESGGGGTYHPQCVIA
ncbi:hypothetical protein CVT26_014338 [Gymnopilus dilepis]|uniref:Uncharacterized protein n=1 Tax=Gymnopilus dilepis TaxID=231916 RepID=A0A409Y718_9AGAR|nr:hypothetical protein CVT26_014338 [Gymnopilus dilepis]